jgi:predicted lipoprotein with Yx(FWY)xxD motif
MACSPTPTHVNDRTSQRLSPTSQATVIRTARVDVDGVIRTVLTNAAGRTLYWFTFDRPEQVACTTQCTLAWPPVLMRGTTLDLPNQPELESFGVVTGRNGRQVEYEGHPLYTSDQDTGPGQANGEGFEDAWYVATVSMPSSW